MSKYNFNSSERFAIFITHGEKCYLCNEPITLKTMEVDHLIPESLLNRPEDLWSVLGKLGLPTDFDVNSFANWLPACGPCNNTKKDHIFRPSLILQRHLEQAAAKVSDAERLASEVVTQRKIANALNVLERASEKDVLAEGVIEILATIVLDNRQPGLAEPIRFSPRCEVLAQQDGVRIVLTTRDLGVPGHFTTVNNATGVVTTGSMLPGGDPNDFELDPETGVFRTRPTGL